MKYLNSNIQLIRNLFPKLRMAARGSVITVIGDDSMTAEFEEKIHSLADYCATYSKRRHNKHEKQPE